MAYDTGQDPRLDPGDGQDALMGAYADAIEAEYARDLQQEKGELYGVVMPLHTRHLRIVKEQPHPRERREHRRAGVRHNDGPGTSDPEAA